MRHQKDLPCAVQTNLIPKMKEATNTLLKNKAMYVIEVCRSTSENQAYVKVTSPTLVHEHYQECKSNNSTIYMAFSRSYFANLVNQNETFDGIEAHQPIM